MRARVIFSALLALCLMGSACSKAPNDAQIASQLQSGLSAVVTVDTHYYRTMFGSSRSADSVSAGR